MKYMELDQVVDEQKQAIEALVDRILAAKQADPTAAVQSLETQIDHLVYRLYNLTPEEITIVEGVEGARSQ
jgi:adenine-specific DNA-methyltransferase